MRSCVRRSEGLRRLRGMAARECRGAGEFECLGRGERAAVAAIPEDRRIAEEIGPLWGGEWWADFPLYVCGPCSDLNKSRSSLGITRKFRKTLSVIAIMSFSPLEPFAALVNFGKAFLTASSSL